MTGQQREGRLSRIVLRVLRHALPVIPHGHHATGAIRSRQQHGPASRLLGHPDLKHGVAAGQADALTSLAIALLQFLGQGLARAAGWAVLGLCWECHRQSDGQG